MLTQNQQKQIAQLLKIDEAQLGEAITAAAEVSLHIADGLKTFTPAELESRDRGVKSKGYNEGKVAGIEMFVSEQKEALGLQFDGKDGQRLVEELQKKTLATAHTQPDEQGDTMTGLRAQLTRLEEQLADRDGAVRKLTLQGKLSAAIPPGLPVDNEEFLYAMERQGYSFAETEEGAIVASLYGEPLTTGTDAQPADYKEVMLHYAREERRWITPDPEPQVGRGGRSSTPRPARHSRATAFEKQWLAEGKSLQSADYSAALTAAAKEGGDGFWEE